MTHHRRTSDHAQTVVVTGASGGTGRAGASVALLAHGEHGLEAAARDVEAGGGGALVVPTDVSDHAQAEAAAQRAEDELGRVTEVNYLGYVHGTGSALKRMLPRDRGTVVQVGSTLAYRGIPLQSAYCGSKHASQGFHESLRTELLHDRSQVRVTKVQMPAVNTPQFSCVLSRLPDQTQPVPPIYQPEVAARAVVYAADHPKRREYWVGGSTAGTLIANAVAPGVLDRYLAPTSRSPQLRAWQHDGLIGAAGLTGIAVATAAWWRR